MCQMVCVVSAVLNLFLLTQQGFSFASVSFVQMVAIGFISTHPPPSCQFNSLGEFSFAG